MVTQVLVDPDDPELQRPTKPIGRTMDEDTARSLAAELGGEVAETKGGWRRVVPSPRPTAHRGARDDPLPGRARATW